MEDVKNFLSRFHESDRVDEVFTSGCCYWFAVILSKRFEDRHAEIVYDEIANHFGAAIDGRVFDITGDVTDAYRWRPWSEMTDDRHRQRIIHYCIQF